MFWTEHGLNGWGWVRFPERFAPERSTRRSYAAQPFAGQVVNRP